LFGVGGGALALVGWFRLDTVFAVALVVPLGGAFVGVAERGVAPLGVAARGAAVGGLDARNVDGGAMGGALGVALVAALAVALVAALGGALMGVAERDVCPLGVAARGVAAGGLDERQGRGDGDGEDAWIMPVGNCGTYPARE
jgi:hypothetical protein